jgi:hypothetical protein
MNIQSYPQLSAVIKGKLWGVKQQQEPFRVDSNWNKEGGFFKVYIQILFY